MASRKEKMAEKKLDAEISQIFSEHCSGIQIDMMDMQLAQKQLSIYIQKVFDAGKKAHAEGRDMRQAIIDIVNELSK